MNNLVKLVMELETTLRLGMKGYLETPSLLILTPSVCLLQENLKVMCTRVSLSS